MDASLMTPSRRTLIATIGAGIGASVAGVGLAGSAGAHPRSGPSNISNVSYDATREVYGDLNRTFVADWKARHGQPISVTQSHGASLRQHDLLKGGMVADVATLAHPAPGLSRRPARLAPYTSTVAFLVRPGNPQALLDWSDLLRPDIELVGLNPRSSAAGRMAHLSAWRAVAETAGEAEADGAMARLYRNAVVLDTSSRAARHTFLGRGSGDVLVTWEHEARTIATGVGAGEVEVVTPSSSLLVRPTVSLVDAHVAEHRSEQLAGAYVNFLYSAPARAIMTAAHLRGADGQAEWAAAERLFTVEDFGGWTAVDSRHFGPSLDRLLTA